MADSVTTPRGLFEFDSPIFLSQDRDILALRSKHHVPVHLGEVIDISFGEFRASGSVVAVEEDLSGFAIQLPETFEDQG